MRTSRRRLDDRRRHTTRLRLRVRPERPHHAVNAGPRAHQLGIVAEPIPYDAVEHLHLLGDLGHDGPKIGARARALKGRLGHFARPEGRDEPSGLALSPSRRFRGRIKPTAARDRD